MAAQARQALAQFTALRVRHQNVMLPGIFHRDYLPLAGSAATDWEGGLARELGRGQPDAALALATSMAREAGQGVEYYQRYQQTALTHLIRAAYLGCLASHAAQLGSAGEAMGRASRAWRGAVRAGAWMAAGAAGLSWLCQKLPWHFLLYYLAPVLVWSRAAWLLATRSFPASRPGPAVLLLALQVIATLLLLRQTFFQRCWLSVGLVVCLAPLAALPRPGPAPPRSLPLLWLACLACLAVFPWLAPVDGRAAHPGLVLLTGLTTTAAALHLLPSPAWLSLGPSLASFTVASTAWLGTTTLPAQLATWLLFCGALPAAVWGSRPHYRERGPALCLALTTQYLTLSLSYEAVFLPVLCLAMALWAHMEDTLQHKKNDHFGEFLRVNRGGKTMKTRVTLQDVSCILSFLFIIVYSFFATGNIASLNSFDPSAIRCFVSVFSPFLMGGLLLVKILIPFLVASLFFIQIIWFRGCDFPLVMNVLQLFCDFLGLLFFDLVQSTGSWLDIGTSLSHFVIVEGTTILIVILLHIAAMISKLNIKVL